MKTKIKKVLIVGAGVAGTDVYKEISRSSKLAMEVVGFIDDDTKKINQKILGSKILGSFDDLSLIIKKNNINQVIIAIPSAEGEKIAEYVKLCNLMRVDVRIVPRVKEIIEGKAQVKTLRKVKVEDLLGRPVVKADVINLKNFFAGKVVLVTGAAGSIGSELSRQIAAYKPKKLLLLDWWESGMFEIKNELDKDFKVNSIEYLIANIQDVNKIKKVFETHKPNIVFNAAAYKHVPLMEDNPCEAVKNNIFGTLNIVRQSYLVGVEKFVLVSTDKAANPKNVMGATKLITEAIGLLYNSKGKTKYMAVRFGNVLDSTGSVVPIFRKQIEEGGPVTITDKKMTRYFMTIPEASQLILKAASMGSGGELFVLDMGKSVKIVDLAENMIRLSGLIPNEDIQIVFTGKRKGEKVKERLFSKKESLGLAKTSDNKIFISTGNSINIKNLNKGLLRLKKLVMKENGMLIVKELSKITKSPLH